MLHYVDLRWNNIGVIGGRALLSSLARNHTLLTLAVDGSNVPSDMVQAIGTCNDISCYFSSVLPFYVRYESLTSIC